MFLAIISSSSSCSSYSWNEWNVRHFFFHNQNNSTSSPTGLFGNDALSCSGLHFWRHFLVKHKIVPNLVISNWLVAFGQSELEKYFEWIIKTIIYIFGYIPFSTQAFDPLPVTGFYAKSAFARGCWTSCAWRPTRESDRFFKNFLACRAKCAIVRQRLIFLVTS